MLFGLLLITILLFVVVSKFNGTAVLPADCAIVFGAAVHPRFDEEGRVVASQAGPGIVRRVETAVELYHRQMIKMLFVSGGRGDSAQESEAEVMRQLAISEGVLPKDVIKEERARSTEENLLLTRPLTSSCSSIVGISDRYHLARIEYMARIQGWEISTFPAQRHSTTIFEIKSVFREVVGLIMFTFTTIF